VELGGYIPQFGADRLHSGLWRRQADEITRPAGLLPTDQEADQFRAGWVAWIAEAWPSSSKGSVLGQVAQQNFRRHGAGHVMR
jgi:hypothetical protein